MISEKVRRFVSSFSEDIKRRNSQTSHRAKKNSEKTFKEAADIPAWPNLSLKISSNLRQSEVDFVVDDKSCDGNLDFLDRCLEGKVGDLECPIPHRLELQRWVDSRWRTAGGVRVVDMSGRYFLFEFPSKEEAYRILREKTGFLINCLCS